MCYIAGCQQTWFTNTVDYVWHIKSSVLVHFGNLRTDQTILYRVKLQNKYKVQTERNSKTQRAINLKVISDVERLGVTLFLV